MAEIEHGGRSMESEGVCYRLSATEATPGTMRPFEHIAFTASFNMLGQPAASICAGHDAEGLSIGLQTAYEMLHPEQRVWPEP